MILTELSDTFDYTEMLGFGIVMAVLCLAVVTAFSTKNLPVEKPAATLSKA